MKQITIFINKETNEQKSLYEVEREYFGEKFSYTSNEYIAFEKWRNEKYDEQDKFIETPYERTRNYVYNTGNRWAIENFNAIHN